MGNDLLIYIPYYYGAIALLIIDRMEKEARHLARRHCTVCGQFLSKDNPNELCERCQVLRRNKKEDLTMKTWMKIVSGVVAIALTVGLVVFIVDYVNVRNQVVPAPVNEIVAPAPADSYTAADSDVTPPTNGEVEKLHGLDKLGVKVLNTSSTADHEFAKWNLQAVSDTNPLKLKLLSGWVYTVRLAQNYNGLSKGDIAVFDGDEKKPGKISVWGATLRYKAAYSDNVVPVDDLNQLVDYEDSYGMDQKPAYHTYAGNF